MKKPDEDETDLSHRTKTQLASTSMKQNQDMRGTVGITERKASQKFPIDQALLDITLDNNDLFTNERTNEYVSQRRQSIPLQNMTRDPQGMIRLNHLQISANLAIISSPAGF